MTQNNDIHIGSLDRLKKTRALVIGDVMLDKYIFGNVFRISPEAPVPVVKTEREKKTLGGAANVAHNIAVLKAGCALVGVAGNDGDRSALLELLDKLGVDAMLIDAGQKTTTKVRVVGERQQIVRIDYEDTFEPTPEISKELLALIDGQIPRADVVVISDYGKGLIYPDLCRHIISNTNKAGKVTVVDPKGSDWSKYKNAVIVTPNVKELGEAAGGSMPNDDEAIVTAGKIIRDRFNIKYLVVTRSEKGMTIVGDNLILHLPTQAQEVFDVSGAGDTVVAVMASLLGAGFSIKEAVAAANTAAGIVVSRIGTVPVAFTELLQALSCNKSEAATPLDQLLLQLDKLRADGKKIVFTNGCFDILHRGHIDYLRKARQLGDLLVVGLNGDFSVKRLKGQSRPVNSQDDRAFVLSALECVDYVVIFEEDTPYELLSAVKPDILVKGGDYKPERVVGREFAKEVIIVDFVDGYSTTATLEKFKELI